MKCTTVIFLLCFVSFGCKTTAPLSLPLDVQKMVKERALFHVQSLNQFNLEALRNIYAEDFAGWAPVVEFKNKEALLQSLEKNYRNNQTQIQATVIDVDAGINMAYVLLDWAVLTTAENETSKVVFEKRLVEIWKKNPQQEWTLSKMLFYHPDEGFGIRQ